MHSRCSCQVLSPKWDTRPPLLSYCRCHRMRWLRFSRLSSDSWRAEHTGEGCATLAFRSWGLQDSPCCLGVKMPMSSTPEPSLVRLEYTHVLQILSLGYRTISKDHISVEWC